MLLLRGGREVTEAAPEAPAGATLLAPAEMVKCDKFNCTLQAGACVQRQDWHGRKTRKGVPVNAGVGALLRLYADGVLDVETDGDRYVAVVRVARPGTEDMS